jgi:hypothetical protein
MADKKISALTAASTPLAGTEVLPIVQSSATVKVSVADLTAGRAISATQLTLTTGNLIVASGQGIDFSATPGTGTSELLADYEEGEWTAAFVPSTSGTITMNNAIGTYTKVGRVVTLNGQFTVTSVSSPTGYLQITGLPFSGGANAKFRCALAINNENMNVTMNTVLVANIQGGSIIYVFKNDGAGSIALTTAADVKAGTGIFIGGTYTTE